MQVPLKVSFQGMNSSDALTAVIRHKVNQLDRYCKQLISVRVMVGRTQHRHRQGNLFLVRVILNLPRKELVVDRNPGLAQAHQDPYVAVRDAFWAAKRQLTEHMKSNLRLKKQLRHTMAQGFVEKILLDREGGFIRSRDERDVYFHRNSVLNGHFNDLNPGDEVRFVEEQGEQGPQASTVEKMGRWGHHEI